MAKGQQRSNREAKKPKKDKIKAAPSTGMASAVERIKERDAEAARKK